MRSMLCRPTLGNLLAVCAASWLLGACVYRPLNDTEAPEPCEYVADGACDEPKGTGLCDEGTDRVDCSGTAITRCRFSNNDVCDEPEGTGKCAEGSDTNDCRGQDATCPFVNDGFCDEPEGGGDCAEGTDAIDCRGQVATCPFTNDGICDEPEGTGNCNDGTDPSDCSDVPAACAFTNNGVCDEPEGSGNCPEGTDSADCARVVCGGMACEPITFSALGAPPGFSAGCCTPNDGCGYTSGNGVCTELFEPQPGYCPNYAIVPTIPLTGCCLPSGMCGLIFTNVPTQYCVEIDVEIGSPLAQFLPTTTVPCELLDSDAGVD
jgi:hypothetical protein